MTGICKNFTYKILLWFSVSFFITAVTVACQASGTTAVATSPPPTIPIETTIAPPPVATNTEIAQADPTLPATVAQPVVTETAIGEDPTEIIPSPIPTNPSAPQTELGILFLDKFIDRSSGWVNEQIFDNYFIGYHEPEWYHVEVHSPQDNAIVVLPDQDFDNVTMVSEVFVEESLTSESGDFRYGLVLRRTGKQFYAFTISPRTGVWSVFKSSPNNLETLQTGIDNSIGAEGTDVLRVDAQGNILSFNVNGRSLATVNDAEYTNGGLGFYVENIDAPRTHIHYDSLTVSEPWHDALIGYDDFADSSSGWVNHQQFDNYYVGYHEPEWYHVEVQSPRDSAIVTLPAKNFDDITVEADLFVEEPLTSQTGDFQYGLAIRRLGKQFYAFTISPRSGTWAVLKSSPNNIEILQSGSNGMISADGYDTLRVDAKGSIMTFIINDEPVSVIDDADYSSGELGFYVETFDSPKAHIHYDSLTLLQPGTTPLQCRVTIGTLNLRSGPGVLYLPIAALPFDTSLQPLSRSSASPWIEVKVPDTGQTGWVYAIAPYSSCTFPLEVLPSS